MRGADAPRSVMEISTPWSSGDTRPSRKSPARPEMSTRRPGQDSGRRGKEDDVVEKGLMIVMHRNQPTEVAELGGKLASGDGGLHLRRVEEQLLGGGGHSDLLPSPGGHAHRGGKRTRHSLFHVCKSTLSNISVIRSKLMKIKHQARLIFSPFKLFF